MTKTCSFKVSQILSFSHEQYPAFSWIFVKMSLETVYLVEKIFTLIFIFNLPFIIPVLKVRVCPRNCNMSIALLSCMFHDCSCIETFSLEGLVRTCTKGSLVVTVTGCNWVYLQICWITVQRSFRCLHRMNSLESENIVNLYSSKILSLFLCLPFFSLFCLSFLKWIARWMLTQSRV